MISTQLLWLWRRGVVQVAAAASVGLVALLAALLSGAGADDFAAGSSAEASLVGTGFVAIVVGAAVVGLDRAPGVLAQRLVLVPGRRRALLVSLATAAVLAALCALVAGLAAQVAGAALQAADRWPGRFDAGHLAAATTASVLAGAVVAVLAASLSALTRSTAAAVVLLLVASPLLQGVAEVHVDEVRVAPTAAADALVAGSAGAAEALVLVAWLVVLAGAALWVAGRRDC